jgi:hypothetical protein
MLANRAQGLFCFMLIIEWTRIGDIMKKNPKKYNALLSTSADNQVWSLK